MLQSAARLMALKRQRMLGERTPRIPTYRLNLFVEQGPDQGLAHPKPMRRMTSDRLPSLIVLKPPMLISYGLGQLTFASLPGIRLEESTLEPWQTTCCSKTKNR